MTEKAIIFTIVFILSMLLFAWSCYRRFSLILLGRPDNRFNEVFRRFGNMLLYAFGQKRVISKPFGINHFFIFWAFVILMLANAEFLIKGIVPSIAFYRLPDTVYFTFSLIFDIVSLIALLAVFNAFIRRIFFPPSNIEARSPDAFIILSTIGLLMVAFFGLHAAETVMGINRAESWLPVSVFFGKTFLSGLSPEGLSAAMSFFWWAHAILLLAFLNYLPYSKHLHVLTAIPNCFFKSLEKIKTQQREEFVKGNTFGAGSPEQFTWKDLFDSYSCTECGRCSDICPATFTGKALNPRLLIHDIKVNLIHNRLKGGNSLPLINGGREGSVSADAIWDCTTCGACMEVCPVFIEHVPKIVDMRRHLVEMKAEFPEELVNFFENMEQRSNPWGIAPAERTKWSSGLDVKVFNSEDTEYLFYVGCAGAFDSRNRKTTRAIAGILDAAGVSWGILGRDELCCGDSMRRLGNEYVFDRMARQNMEVFKQKKITRIITQCPHCFSTLQNDYAQFGGELEVVHHSVFIKELIASGRLKLDAKHDSGNVVYHDPCYLGRYNEIYDEPREVLSNVTGRSPSDMDRKREKAFCCGAGGGRMWMEEEIGKQVNIARVEEVLSRDPETVCVACPYCMTMFEDGLQNKNAADIKVLDIAEIVAGALPE